MAEFEQGNAVVVGISKYQWMRDLKEVSRDASGVYDLLVNPDRCAYPTSQVELIRDRDATKPRLLKAIEGLADRCDENSTAIFFLSGHGGLLRSDRSQCFLLPSDARTDTDENLRDTAISAEEFRDAWSAVRSRRKVVMLDCCHAAGTGTAAFKSSDSATVKVGINDDLLDSLKIGKGHVVFSSSRADEFSFILENDVNSLFTKHLLAALDGAVASQDGLVRVLDLFDYVSINVNKQCSYQHPVMKCEVEDNFPIALWKAGAKGPDAQPHSPANDQVSITDPEAYQELLDTLHKLRIWLTRIPPTQVIEIRRIKAEIAHVLDEIRQYNPNFER